MVRIERITRPKPEPEMEDTGDRFLPIDIYIQEPTNEPDESASVQARPYEFVDDKPSKFSSSCPHCGQGIFFEFTELKLAVDCYFLGCPECGKGIVEQPGIPIDPFINPIGTKIAPSELDSNLASANTVPESKSASVAEQLGNDLLEVLDDDSEPPKDPIPVDDSELIGMDKDELEQILQEFEDE